MIEKDKKRSGFTLVELLVVISVLGILITFILPKLGLIEKRGRDTQRKSDLNQTRVALENYAGANNEVYPIYTPNTVLSTVCSAKLTAYLSKCPTDPIGGTNYNYAYSSDASGTKYVLWTLLESGGYWEICSDGKIGKVTNLPGSGQGICTL